MSSPPGKAGEEAAGSTNIPGTPAPTNESSATLPAKADPGPTTENTPPPAVSSEVSKPSPEGASLGNGTVETSANDDNVEKGKDEKIAIPIKKFILGSHPISAFFKQAEWDPLPLWQRRVLIVAVILVDFIGAAASVGASGAQNNDSNFVDTLLGGLVTATIMFILEQILERMLLCAQSTETKLIRMMAGAVLGSLFVLVVIAALAAVDGKNFKKVLGVFITAMLLELFVIEIVFLLIMYSCCGRNKMKAKKLEHAKSFRESRRSSSSAKKRASRYGTGNDSDEETDVEAAKNAEVNRNVKGADEGAPSKEDSTAALSPAPA